MDYVIGTIVGGMAVYLWLWLRQYEKKKLGRRYDLSDPANQLRFVQGSDFRTRKPINREAFTTVYKVVEDHLETLKPKYRILSEVSMGSFLGTPISNGDFRTQAMNDRAFKSINSKRVDFLVIDPSGMPALAIEYHGTGHHRGNARDRDAVKHVALDKAQLPLIVIHPGTSRSDVTDAVGRELERHELQRQHA